jgi:uncharacterized damage-inducible protein DinB
MTTENSSIKRRHFLKTAATLSSVFSGMLLLPEGTFSKPVIHEPSLTIIGPQDGYSPQIGTLVSMMAWCRNAVVSAVKGMSVEQLDYLLDNKANTIGALLFHLASTDAFYHEHTFKGIAWGSWEASVEKKFGVAMELGEPARQSIKGNSLDFYLTLLNETRESTLAEFRKRDDHWLMTVDKTWGWGPTNIYCKWFHVCEHESHHQGQIALLKSRVPGIKTS